jgi:hypothetical protein
MSFDIVNNVSVPEGRNSYPFRYMEVGDSFLVPFDQVRNQNSIRSAASHFARRTGLARFSVITEDNGYRVFRVA